MENDAHYRPIKYKGSKCNIVYSKKYSFSHVMCRLNDGPMKVLGEKKRNKNVKKSHRMQWQLINICQHLSPDDCPEEGGPSLVVERDNDAGLRKIRPPCLRLASETYDTRLIQTTKTTSVSLAIQINALRSAVVRWGYITPYSGGSLIKRRQYINDHLFSAEFRLCLGNQRCERIHRYSETKNMWTDHLVEGSVHPSRTEN